MNGNEESDLILTLLKLHSGLQSAEIATRPSMDKSARKRGVF
jgi:hypothetical protein